MVEETSANMKMGQNLKRLEMKRDVQKRATEDLGAPNQDFYYNKLIEDFCKDTTQDMMEQKVFDETLMDSVMEECLENVCSYYSAYIKNAMYGQVYTIQCSPLWLILG